ncbi:unnamed protein product [Somion occarium]|uniref:Uncharacterized protein n=1 Tax=Somion occarium TaxID=3059160 RepID=A0ABP1D3X6_9APHY
MSRQLSIEPIYDARLLLHEAPSIEHSTSSVDRLSPTGWSDLPSDAEDTFFFSPEEAEDYHREKRRRLIERSREDRLRAIRAEHEEEESEAQEKDLWGDSDEEPDETQKELMRRTASHVLSSPNPAQLEMRILANHGADIRFAFLRGRWSRSWNATKAKVRLALNKDIVQPMSGALGGLSGYGGSDEDSGDEAETSAAIPEAVVAVDGQMDAPNDDQADDAAVKEARRAKAKEWSLKRRALKEGKEEPEKS